MIQDIEISGIYLPALLVIAFASVCITAALTRLLSGAGLYRRVAQRPLVDLALFIITLGLLVQFA